MVVRIFFRFRRCSLSRSRWSRCFLYLYIININICNTWTIPHFRSTASFLLSFSFYLKKKKSVLRLFFIDLYLFLHFLYLYELLFILFRALALFGFSLFTALSAAWLPFSAPLFSFYFSAFLYIFVLVLILPTAMIVIH